MTDTKKSNYVLMIEEILYLYQSEYIITKEFMIPNWNPTQYDKFIKDRTQPAIDLANRL